MVKRIGTVPEGKRRGLLSSVTAQVSEKARLQAEMAEGAGLRRLVGAAEHLADHVTLVIRPQLGFMNVDACLIGAGKVLVINTLHWQGKITAGLQDEWVGGGSVDLGRPDRRAHVFADRLSFAGLAAGFAVEPVVVVTAGAVDMTGLQPLSRLVQWAEAEAFLTQQFPPGVAGFDPTALIKALAR